MAQKKVSKTLSSKILLYWLLNVATLIHLVIIYLSNISNNAPQNNAITHFLYNITSIFVIIPTLISYLLRFIFFREDFVGFSQSYYYTDALIAIFLIGLLANYVLSKIIFTSFIQNLYRKYLESHPRWTITIVVVIIILFAVG